MSILTSRCKPSKKDPFPTVTDCNNKSMNKNFDIIKEEDEDKAIKKCSPKKGYPTSQSPKKVTAGEFIFKKEKTVSPIRPAVTPNSGVGKYKSKINNISGSETSTNKYLSTFHGGTTIRPFSGIINAKKIVKNHMNKMLATLNESMGSSVTGDRKESKFDGKGYS
jgi:hypothetical protein